MAELLQKIECNRFFHLTKLPDAFTIKPLAFYQGGVIMKMLKKAASVALASAMVFSLAACGSNGGGSDEGNSDATTFKIGSIGPITGDTAIYGTAVQNGIQLAVDEINADGGINGYQIEYKFEDDQSDSEKSVNAYNTLKDWGMQMLVRRLLRRHMLIICSSSHRLLRL